MVHRVVAIAGASTGDGDDPTIVMACEHMHVARVTVVLRAARDVVISGRNQRAVDEPAAAAIVDRRYAQQRGEPRDEVDEDAMRLRRRDPEQDGELSQREVGPQARAHNDDPGSER